MRIATVCGIGLGACEVLASHVRSVLADVGIDASVAPVDLDSLRGMRVDIAVGPRTMHGHLATTEARLVLIDNLLDRTEVRVKLLEATGGHG